MKTIQYYHRICAVTIVSSAFPIPLGIRFQNEGRDRGRLFTVLVTGCAGPRGSSIPRSVGSGCALLCRRHLFDGRSLGFGLGHQSERQSARIAGRSSSASPQGSARSTQRINRKNCSSGTLQKSIGRSQTAASGSQNGPHATEESNPDGSKRGRAEATAERNGRRTKHQLLCQQSAIGHHSICVRPSIRPQSLGHRYRKCFRPSPPTATSKTHPCIRAAARRCLCSP